MRGVVAAGGDEGEDGTNIEELACGVDEGPSKFIETLVVVK